MREASAVPEETPTRPEDARSRAVTARLNQAGRRMRGAANEEAWRDAVLDAAQGFAPRVALFQAREGVLRCLGARGFAVPASFTVPLSAAPAIRTALAGSDLLVSLRSASELSPAIAELLAAEGEGRTYLFPVLTGGQASEVLCADAGLVRPDVSALELVALLAGALRGQTPTEDTDFAAEPHTNVAVPPSRRSDLIQLAPAASAPAPSSRTPEPDKTED